MQAGGLDQAHDHGGSASGAIRASKEPVLSSERYGTDAVLDPVVTWHASDRRPSGARTIPPNGVSFAHRDRGDGSTFSGQAVIRQ